MVDAKTHELGHVGVAITFGLVIMAMIYAVGHVSGAHFNGAVTFAFALTRHFPWPRAAAYWAAQLTGAIVAAAILRGSLGNIANVGATLPSGSDRQSFLWEIVLTAILMFVIMAVATDTRAVGEAAAIAIGGTVGLDAMFGGPISGASMNPMRSMGPAFVSGDLDALWIYIVAPVIGAVRGSPALPVRPRRAGPAGYVIGISRSTTGSMRSRISSRLGPVTVIPWLRRPTTAWSGSGAWLTSSGDRPRQLLRAARVVHVRGVDALHPRVDVDDRADVRVLLVDHPVLDRVHRDAAGLDVRRHAQHHAPVLRVVVRDEQDVAPGHFQAGLVHPARAHPEPTLVLARGQVPVGEPTDAVQALHVPELALVEQVLDRERAREQVELLEPDARLADRDS